MPQLKVTLDERVLLDGDSGRWTADQQRTAEDLVAKATLKHEPWSGALLSAMLDVSLHQRDAAIAIRTKTDGWTVEVTDGHNHAAP